MNEATKKGIQLDLEEFHLNPTSKLACSLMGAGIVTGDNQLAFDMATFLKKKVESINYQLNKQISY